MPRVQLTVVIDTDRPLGPQVAVARAYGLPWKLLEDMTGRTRRWLQALAATSQLRERQTVSLCVLNVAAAPDEGVVPLLGVSSLNLGPVPLPPAPAPLSENG